MGTMSLSPFKGQYCTKNAVADKFVNDVLTNPNTVKTNISGGGVDNRLPDGRGIRYNADGSFNTDFTTNLCADTRYKESTIKIFDKGQKICQINKDKGINHL